MLNLFNTNVPSLPASNQRCSNKLSLLAVKRSPSKETAIHIIDSESVEPWPRRDDNERDMPLITLDIEAKVRSTREAIPAQLTLNPDGSAQVQFSTPEYGVSPGQACVFYQDDRILGGGWIC